METIVRKLGARPGSRVLSGPGCPDPGTAGRLPGCSRDWPVPRQLLTARRPMTPAVTARVQALLPALRRQDLAALDDFKRLKPVLRATLGAQALRDVTAALDSLEFTQARDLLAAGLQSEEGDGALAEPAACSATTV